MDSLFDHDHYGEERDALFQSSDRLGNSSLQQRLLVIVGEDSESQHVVVYALHRATRAGADVHFLSILTTQVVWGLSDVMASAVLDASAIAACAQVELAWAAAAAEDAAVPYTTSQRWGNIPATIRHTANMARCPLIVMGPYIRTGCEPLAGRYFAHRVAVQARRPVLAVPSSLPATETGLAWQHFLVVIDGSAAADLALEHTLMLAQDERLTLCLLQALPSSPRAAARAREACTVAAAQAAAAGVRYDVQHAHGDLVTAILRTAAAQQCDVVVHGVPAGNLCSRLWHGCPTKALLERATLPVLLVPST